MAEDEKLKLREADKTEWPPPESGQAFEARVRPVLEERFGAKLPRGKVPPVPTEFDYVSADGRIVGDAKFFTLVRGVDKPPAKNSNISEYVWLLQKTDAPVKFLAFGRDVRVPQGWLDRYGHLADGVEFLFIDGEDVRTISPP